MIDLDGRVSGRDQAPVAVVGVDEIRRASPNPSPVVRAGAHVVIVPTAGRGRHMVDFEQYEVGPGTALHVQPGQIHQVDRSGRLAARVLVVAASRCPIGVFPPGDPVPLVPLGQSSPIVTAVVADLEREQLTASPDVGILVAGAAYLLQHLAQARRAAHPGSGSHGELLRRFRAEVERSFAETRTVSTYARALGRSTKTLTRATTGLTGLGPKEIIDERVVLEAKRLLAHTSCPVATIAAAVGFSEATNFTKFFVRRTGTTPRQFRSLVRVSIEPNPR